MVFLSGTKLNSKITHFFFLQISATLREVLFIMKLHHLQMDKSLCYASLLNKLY